MPFPTTLVIGDTHAPYVKRRTLDAVVAFCARLKPKRIVQVGDLYDMYSSSRFPRSHNVHTPQQEITVGRKVAECFWRDLRMAAGPDVECYQLKGNHDERPAKLALSRAPELIHLLEKGLEALWEFDGVQTQPTERDELILDGVCFMHGYRRHGHHVTYNLMPTVVGHLHVGGTVFMRLKGKTIWELNAGYIANPEAFPMSYSRQARISRCTHGIGVIDDLGPRFVPL